MMKMIMIMIIMNIIIMILQPGVCWQSSTSVKSLSPTAWTDTSWLSSSNQHHADDFHDLMISMTPATDHHADDSYDDNDKY